MASLLKSRFAQWLSTPLRRHLSAHTTRIVRIHTSQLPDQVSRLTSAVAVVSKRNHVQATNLAGSIRLSEDTRAQLTEIRDGLDVVRAELAEFLSRVDDPASSGPSEQV